MGDSYGEHDSGRIGYCYATGRVEGNEKSGGLTGDSNRWAPRVSFWDMDTSGQFTSAGGTGAKGLHTIDMQAAATPRRPGSRAFSH